METAEFSFKRGGAMGAEAVLSQSYKQLCKLVGGKRCGSSENAGKFGKEFRVITGEAMMALRTHPWYGNVRELENTMEFMVNMMEEGVLDLETLPVDFDEQKPGERQEEEYLTLKELEARAIGRALERFGTTTEGKKEAAKSLGISLATLYRKMDDFSK